VELHRLKAASNPAHPAITGTGPGRTGPEATGRRVASQRAEARLKEELSG